MKNTRRRTNRARTAVLPGINYHTRMGVYHEAGRRFEDVDDMWKSTYPEFVQFLESGRHVFTSMKEQKEFNAHLNAVNNGIKLLRDQFELCESIIENVEYYETD